jgi:membrane protease YdiL (CAAX protease family)
MSNRSKTVQAFAADHALRFALLFFAASVCLGLALHVLLPAPTIARGTNFIDLIMQMLLAVSVLAWLGWLQGVGLNAPSQWRGLRLLWLPALIALFYLSPLLFLHVPNTGLIEYAAVFALLTGLNEEARFRGVILQALLPYGPLGAAALSALFFAAAHLNNLLFFGANLLVFAQVVGAFLIGFGFAAIRLRTNTLWLLVIIHALYDLTADIALFAAPRSMSAADTPLLAPQTVTLALIGLGLILAAYGLFLLRPRGPSTRPFTIHAQV